MKATVEGIKELLTLEEFPYFYEDYCKCVGFYEDKNKGIWWSTMDVEKEGKRFKKIIGDVTETERFVWLVTKWGGKTGNRIRGILKKYQSREEIAKAIKNATHQLERDDIESAIGEITSLKGLGISYGSKILRMLSPEQAGVYDSVLIDVFIYPDTPDGYAEFCRDCKKLAVELKKRGIKNPVRESGVWFVADVEAAIFQCCRS